MVWTRCWGQCSLKCPTSSAPTHATRNSSLAVRNDSYNLSRLVSLQRSLAWVIIQGCQASAYSSILPYSIWTLCETLHSCSRCDDEVGLPLELRARRSDGLTISRAHSGNGSTSRYAILVTFIWNVVPSDVLAVVSESPERTAPWSVRGASLSCRAGGLPRQRHGDHAAPLESIEKAL